MALFIDVWIVIYLFARFFMSVDEAFLLNEVKRFNVKDKINVGLENLIKSNNGRR
jgi:hypothetical protein